MATPSIRLEWVRPPLQARSAKTLARLLDAAEAILAEDGMDALTVAEVARRAGSSVGAFYARFQDKDALVRCVLERFHEEAIATTQASLAPARWEGVDLRAVLPTMLGFMVQMLSLRRPLVLAFVVRAARDAQVRELGARLHRQICESMRALLAHRGETMTHAHPEVGVEMAVWMVLSVMQSRVLHPRQELAALGDEVIAAELTQMVTSYLGLATRP